MNPADLNGNPIPYRVIFAKDLTAGTVLLVRCGKVVPAYDTCSGGTTHAIDKWHQITLTAVHVEGQNVTGIAVDEDGNQQPVLLPTHTPCHVYTEPPF